MNNNGAGISQYHNIINTLFSFSFCFNQKKLVHVQRFSDSPPPVQSFWFFGSEFLVSSGQTGEFKLRTILEYYDILGENSISEFQSTLSRARPDFRDFLMKKRAPKGPKTVLQLF